MQHRLFFSSLNSFIALRAVLALQASGAKRKLLHVPKYDKWDSVSLEYRVAWPLHLLLTPQVQLVNTLTDIITNADVTQILTFAATSQRRCPMAISVYAYRQFCCNYYVNCQSSMQCLILADAQQRECTKTAALLA